MVIKLYGTSKTRKIYLNNLKTYAPKRPLASKLEPVPTSITLFKRISEVLYKRNGIKFISSPSIYAY